MTHAGITESQHGVFIESPHGVRDGGGPRILVWDSDMPPGNLATSFYLFLREFGRPVDRQNKYTGNIKDYTTIFWPTAGWTTYNQVLSTPPPWWYDVAVNPTWVGTIAITAEHTVGQFYGDGFAASAVWLNDNLPDAFGIRFIISGVGRDDPLEDPPGILNLVTVPALPHFLTSGVSEIGHGASSVFSYNDSRVTPLAYTRDVFAPLPSSRVWLAYAAARSVRWVISGDSNYLSASPTSDGRVLTPNPTQFNHTFLSNIVNS